MAFLKEICVREEKLKKRSAILSGKETELVAGNECLMRECELLAGEFFKKDATKNQLYRLQETLSFKVLTAYLYTCINVSYCISIITILPSAN